MPEDFVSLGRTVGMPANGAVSNVALTPAAVFAAAPRAARGRLRRRCTSTSRSCRSSAGTRSASAGELPLVGTFHTYSENVLTNGLAAGPLGGRRRMNRLHVRIAVSEAAAWTARRFYGGRYRIIPNGVQLPDRRSRTTPIAARSSGTLRILFVGQAVERKGLPVLLRAFEALREHIPATLTLVGASSEEVAHMMLDDRGVRALGKVSEERKLAELARADVLCAPSLHGESFGMVLTEAFAAARRCVASDIPGYRDVVRDGTDGLLVAARRSRSRSPRRCARWRSTRPCVRGWRAPRASAPSASPGRASPPRCSTATRRRCASAPPATPRRARRRALRPRARRPAAAHPRRAAALAHRARRRRWSGARDACARCGAPAVVLSTVAGAGLAALVLQRVGVDARRRVARGLQARAARRRPRADVRRDVRARDRRGTRSSRAAPTWRRAKRRDAMQGTFIGVLMSATLPARLGEPSRALIVARRVGRARETLPSCSARSSRRRC